MRRSQVSLKYEFVPQSWKFNVEHDDTEMGPSLVMPVKRGDRVGLSSKYFYEEDAPRTVYDDLGHFVNEILIALATSGAGILQLLENHLLHIAGSHTET